MRNAKLKSECLTAYIKQQAKYRAQHQARAKNQPQQPIVQSGLLDRIKDNERIERNEKPATRN